MHARAHTALRTKHRVGHGVLDGGMLGGAERAHARPAWPLLRERLLRNPSGKVRRKEALCSESAGTPTKPLWLFFHRTLKAIAKGNTNTAVSGRSPRDQRSVRQQRRLVSAIRWRHDEIRLYTWFSSLINLDCSCNVCLRANSPHGCQDGAVPSKFYRPHESALKWLGLAHRTCCALHRGTIAVCPKTCVVGPSLPASSPKNEVSQNSSEHWVSRPCSIDRVPRVCTVLVSLLLAITTDWRPLL